MKIIVVCETIVQFNEYVRSMLQDENKLPVKRIVTKNHSGIITRIDDLEFIYCYHPDKLRGRTFGKNDYIVRVGTWYNISEETMDDIAASFMARITE